MRKRTVRSMWFLEGFVLFCLLGCQVPRQAGDESAVSRTTGLPVIARSDSTDEIGGSGLRMICTNGEASVPVVVVSGTSREMGWHLGRLMRAEILSFIPGAADAMKKRIKVSDEDLDAVWQQMAPHMDPRLKEELEGVAAGSGLPLRTLRHIHCLPMLMPYSCSSIAAWGEATRDGHLYQTRDLDWTMSLGAHNVPVIVVYKPTSGLAHVVPTFAGFSGAHCGMNQHGLTLAEMGDSPAREMPYDLNAPHFTGWFRTLLYDCANLDDALTRFTALPMTKRYHFVFGDGGRHPGAAKIRAHSPEPEPRRLLIWRDNDPTDELAPHVLPGVVYQDEGRGAYPILKAKHGILGSEDMVDLCNHLPIHGSNVMDVVFDATALELWVSYAKDTTEAYTRPYVHLDLKALF